MLEVEVGEEERLEEELREMSIVESVKKVEEQMRRRAVEVAEKKMTEEESFAEIESVIPNFDRETGLCSSPAHGSMIPPYSDAECALLMRHWQNFNLPPAFTWAATRYGTPGERDGASRTTKNAKNLRVKLHNIS